jgi:hypothetical protein
VLIGFWVSSIFAGGYELGATAPLPLYLHKFLQIGIHIVVWQKSNIRDASMKNIIAFAVLIFPNDVLLPVRLFSKYDIGNCNTKP